MGQRKPNNEHFYKLRIENLSKQVTREMLRNDFGPYGEIADVHIPTRGGEHRHMATVSYYKVTDAEDALEKMNNTVYDGQSISIEIYYPPNR